MHWLSFDLSCESGTSQRDAVHCGVSCIPRKVIAFQKEQATFTEASWYLFLYLYTHLGQNQSWELIVDNMKYHYII